MTEHVEIANSGDLGMFDVSSNKPSDSSQDLPLGNLTVYVEIISNKTNISETTYKYLQMLGAKVEKRLNRKCNLVIWKDGGLKTIHKARAYEIPIVNSLWLEECLESGKCAEFDKFLPKMLTDQEWPFLAIQRPLKRKRQSIDRVHIPKSDGEMREPRAKKLIGLECHKTKKKKMNTSTSRSKSKSKDAKKTKKVRVKIQLTETPTTTKRKSRTKSLSKEPRPKTSKRNLVPTRRRRPTKNSKSPSIKLGTLHWRLMKFRKPDLGSLEGLDMECESPEIEKSVSSPDTPSPLGADLEAAIEKRREEYESMRVRDMILSYARASPTRIERPYLFSEKDTDIEDETSRGADLFDNGESRSNYNVSLGSEKNSERSMQEENKEFADLCMLEENEPVNVEAKGSVWDFSNEGKILNTNSATPQTKAGSSVKKTPATPECPNNTEMTDIAGLLEEDKSEEELNPVDLSAQFFESAEKGTPVTVKKGRKSSIKSNRSTQKKENNNKESKEKKENTTPKKGKKKADMTTPTRTLEMFGFVSKKTPVKEKMVEDEMRVQFNSFRRSEMMILKEFCGKFGLKYQNDEIRNVEESEILVCEGNEVTKNYKSALAMALGKTLVREDWVLESLKAESLLSYKDFEIKYDKDIRKGLLKKLKFQVDKELEVMPVNMATKNHFVDLIERAGGTIYGNIKACDFIIMRKTTKKKKSGAPSHVKVVTPQWITDSVVEGKLMNTDLVAYKVL